MSSSQSAEQQETNPLRSEQALVSANTKRAQDLQADAATTSQEAGLNLKKFPPPNTAERYYFSSPANHSAPSHDSKSSIPENVKSSQEQVVVASSGLMSTSSPMIWSIARMSKTASAAVTTSTTSFTSRPSMLPIGLGGAVSIYKTSTCISSVSSTTATTPSHGYLVPKERPADILSPVTESASVLSYINKTSNLTNGGSRLFESESDPPALSAYLQERAAVRAANKSTPFNVTARGESMSPKSAIPNSTPEAATTTAVAASVTTSTSSSMKSQYNATSEDKYAPRNVTMNVKDLPEDVTSSGSRHPQLPQDVHLATANAMAKGAATAAAAISSAASLTADVNLLSPVASDNKSESSKESRTRSNSESQQTEIFQTNEDGKSVCGICSKIFSKASQLRLHVNIHYFERPFRYLNSVEIQKIDKGEIHQI